MKNAIIIKLETACFQDHDRVNKIIGTLDAKNFAKLIDAVGLTANPRKSKVGKITSAIQDTLEISPELFRFKSKGLLVSTSSCKKLDRNRFQLSFEDETYEGVLDGGHNMLAIGIHLLLKLGESEKEIRKIKLWDQFIKIWKSQDKDSRDDLLGDEELNKISIPVEIVHPTELELPNFMETVWEISDARNNNDSLSSTTKSEFKKYYEILKTSLDPKINNKIEWKDNTADKSIKAQDIIAMSLIPLYALQELDKMPKGPLKINPVNIYSSKSKCVEVLNSIIKAEYDRNGSEEVKDPYLLSAFGIMKDLPRLYDLIYEKFPSAYNKAGSFGRIESVRLYDPKKKADGRTYLRVAPKTKYYENECVYKYPDGFIMPIFAALSEWMEIKGNKVQWKLQDPFGSIEKNLAEFVKMLIEVSIKSNGYNAQSVGKNPGAYMIMSQTFQYNS
jgi:hypothetical protein